MDSNKPVVGIDLVYNAESVPLRLQQIVCTCRATDTYGWQFEADDKPLTCRKCHKMPRYLVRQCKECKQLFAKDFRHPNYTSDYPLCWDDIETVHNVTTGFRDNRIVPPVFARKLKAYDNFDTNTSVFSFGAPTQRT